MSDDLISRQAAIDIVFRSPFFFDSLTEELRALPSVQQKTGRWTLDRVSYLLEYVCANCKASFPSIASEGEFYSKLNCANMNFCPNCGAKKALWENKEIEKMTIEEAIRAIRHDLHWNLLKGYQEDVAKIAISALEKQIPKKTNRGACPSCGSRHIYAATLMKAECFKYCGDCGQAIDWSDNDD